MAWTWVLFQLIKLGLIKHRPGGAGSGHSQLQGQKTREESQPGFWLEELISGWKGWQETPRLSRAAGMGLGLTEGGGTGIYWGVALTGIYWPGRDGTGTYWRGFSPVWIRRWMIKLLLVRKERAQNSQM